MHRLERHAEVLDASVLAILHQLRMQQRGDHTHTRARPEQKIDLAQRDGAAADYQREFVPQVEKYRQIIHVAQTPRDAARGRALQAAATGRWRGCRPHSRESACSHHQRPVQMPGANIGPDLILGPVQQRTDLLQAVLRVMGDGLRLSALVRLVAPHARDPGAVAGNGTPERFELAALAAAQACPEGVIETVDAVFAHIALHGIGIGIVDSNATAIMQLQPLHQLQGLFGQAPGIDAEHVDFRRLRTDQVGHDHGFGAEAVGIDHPAELADRLAQQRYRGVDPGAQ